MTWLQSSQKNVLFFITNNCVVQVLLAFPKKAFLLSGQVFGRIFGLFSYPAGYPTGDRHIQRYPARCWIWKKAGSSGSIPRDNIQRIRRGALNQIFASTYTLSCYYLFNCLPGGADIKILDLVGLLGQDLHARVVVDRHGAGGDEKLLQREGRKLLMF